MTTCTLVLSLIQCVIVGPVPTPAKAAGCEAEEERRHTLTVKLVPPPQMMR